MFSLESFPSIVLKNTTGCGTTRKVEGAIWYVPKCAITYTLRIEYVPEMVFLGTYLILFGHISLIFGTLLFHNWLYRITIMVWQITIVEEQVTQFYIYVIVLSTYLHFL